MLDLVPRDLGHALRRLHRAPLFSLIAILTLGLAMGAATTVFSVVNSVLLQPLRYGAGDRLVIVWNDFGQGAQSLPAVSSTDYLEYRSEATLFDGFAAGAGPGVIGASGILIGEGPPERVQVTPVSANFFPLIGVEPILGRQFTEAEEAFNGPKVAMLSHRLWRRRFGGDPGIVGRTIRMDGLSYQVVAVLPPGFRLELPAEVYQIKDGEVWTPLQFDRGSLPPRNLTTFTAIGRLKPGVSLAQAQAQMDGLAARFRSTYPEHQGSQVRIRIVPLRQDVVKGVRPGILTLLGAVGILLVIACANIANLLLARAAARASEFSIRVAVGAAPAQIAGQLLTEAGVLAVLGGALALALATAALSGLAAISPAGLPRLGEIRIDWWSGGFTALLCLSATLAFGLAPALSTVGGGAGEALRAGGRLATYRRGARLTRGLVGAEIALSLVLLIGSGLLVRSFLALQQARPGFHAEGALSFRVALPRAAYPNPDARTAFYEEVDRRLRALPGVTAVGRVSQLPLTGSGALAPYAYDEATARNWESVTAEGRAASPDYFRAIGTGLISGRFFTAGDVKTNGTADQVIIIDETLARRAWPDGHAVDRQLQVNPTGEPNQFARVIGVVEYTRIRELAADGLPQMYYPLWPGREASYVVRTTGDPRGLLAPIEREVTSLDPTLAVSELAPMDALVTRALAAHRLSLILMQAVAGLALLLGVIGVYGVIAESLGQRRREFGVRLVLGESPGGLQRRVLLEGARLVLPSLLLGLLIAIGGSRLVGGLLYGISPTDPPTFVAASILLGLVALGACYPPAVRASRASPLVVLSAE